MTPESLPPADYLMYVLGGKGRAAAVSTAAAWRLADRLAGGARSPEELAAEIGRPVEAMKAVVRVCAGLGFFEPAARAGAFALTERGRALCSDTLGPMAEFIGVAEQWDPWAALRHVREGGETAFELANARPLYEWMAQHPEGAAGYDAAIDSFTRHEARALCAAFDFSRAKTVVDVGGGRGSLLAAVMDANPHLRGVLFDLPHVADRARGELVARFAGRVEARGGDFFAQVPASDVVMCKHVLHNWNDERAVDLLRRCAGAIATNDGRVLVIESVLSPDHRADMAAMLDLEMQVLLGGRVRRKPELRRLIAESGLSIERFEPLTAGTWLAVVANG